MKLGFRKPSFKRSLSAMTRGALTRSIKKALLPGYGQRGKSYYTSFGKSAYNKVYNLTTTSIFDLFKTPKRTLSERDYFDQKEYYYKKKKAIDVHLEGLKVCQIIIEFCKTSCSIPLNNSIKKAIDRVLSRTNRYIDRGYGKDCFDFIIQELNSLKETSLKEVTQYECEIAIDIINQIAKGRDKSAIFEDIKNKYPEKKKSDFPNNPSSPDVFPYNPNWEEEGKQQLELFHNLSKQISAGTVYMPAIHIKLLNLVTKYYSIMKKQPVNLFDYMEYELTNKFLSSKRDTTKNDYQQALEILHMMKTKMSSDEIYDCLKRNKHLR